MCFVCVLSENRTRTIHKDSIYSLDRCFLGSGLKEKKDREYTNILQGFHSLFEHMRFEATSERGKKDAESTRAIHKKSIYCLDRRFLRSGLREEKDHPNKQLAKVHSLFEQMRLEARFEREEGSESYSHKQFTRISFGV